MNAVLMLIEIGSSSQVTIEVVFQEIISFNLFLKPRIMILRNKVYFALIYE